MIAETDTIIIGAGPAGLAVGAVLRRANIPFVMLERGDRVGESWHRHYERLHLHTPKAHSALPYHPYPRDYPRYPSRRQMVEYLEDYARTFEIEPEFGREVQRCARGSDGAWEASTDAGKYRGRRVVVAAGFNRTPNTPRWPGQETFPGRVLHSRDYISGAAFRDKRVLVIGFGNSGAEIALDLAEHGARCAVAVRGKVNVIPRDLFGIPIIVYALACRPLPPRVADAMNSLTLRLAVGNLEAMGLSKRDDGPFAEIAECRQIPVIDVGTLARIRSGDIDVRKGVEGFNGSEVRFADGARERFDAVVLATGFTPGLPPILGDHASVLDSTGRPRERGRESSLPGLYFCGYDLSSTGMLRQIGIEAFAIGRDIRTKAAQRVG
jgi:indole-3-pyruvate monooxygenase